LFGKPVLISRTGYTGERGYELFCKGEDAPLIWDTILAEGKPLGIVPACFTTLDYLRVESSLLFFPYDMSQMYPFPEGPPGDSLWELGLDFTVSPGKTDFAGADAHYRLKGRERFKIFGLLIDSAVAADMGDAVYAGATRVGVVTCAMVSTLTGKSMAIVRLDVPYAVHGTKLAVRGKSLSAAATAHTLPFDDPEKKKRTTVG
jgi:aminomethyltransferase